MLIAAVAVGPLVLHWLTNEPDQRLVDLDVYRSGGQAVLRGAPVYDFLTQPPQLLPFTYPTFAVLLAVPLALLPWAAAQWAWTALIFIAMTLVVRSLLRSAARPDPAVGADHGRRSRGVVRVRHAVAGPDPFRTGRLLLVALCMADSRPPVRAGLAASWSGWPPRSSWCPASSSIYFLVTGRRREAITAAVAAVAATLVTFVVLPADSADYWFHALFDSERLGSNTATTNQSIRGMLLRLYWPDAVTSLLWLVCVAIVAYFGFRSARRAWLAGDEIRGIAITGLIAVLVSPVAWIHHLAWLVVVFGAIVGDGRDLAARRARRRHLAFLPARGALVGDHDARGPHGPRFLGRIVQDAYGLGALGLLVFLRSPRPRSPSAESDGVDTSRNRSRVGTLNS